MLREPRTHEAVDRPAKERAPALRDCAFLCCCLRFSALTHKEACSWPRSPKGVGGHRGAVRADRDEYDERRQHHRAARVVAFDALLADPAPAGGGAVGDSPVRRALGEGDNSFEQDPPNAVLSFAEPGERPPKDVLVVLRTPAMDGAELRYTVEVLDGSLPNTTGPCALLIDPFGRPLSPVSAAGTHRRAAGEVSADGATATTLEVTDRRPCRDQEGHPTHASKGGRPMTATTVAHPGVDDRRATGKEPEEADAPIEPRRLEAGPRSARPGRDPGRAECHPRARPGAGAPRAHDGLAVHLLPRCGQDHGCRPRRDADGRPHGAALR